MSQIQWTVSLVLIGLFAVAIIGFSINFASDNSSPVSISNDPELSGLYGDINTNLGGLTNDTENTYTSIVNTSISPTSASGTTTTAGQFAITPANVISIVKNTLEVGYIKIFGTGSGFGVFITTFLGMIVFITGLLIWKTWAGRTPD